MNLRQNRFLLILVGLGMAIASGQTQDNSGNGLLKGTYVFRNVAIQPGMPQVCGMEDVVFIEVQTGPILSEDDIERLEDSYGRS